MVHDGLTGPQVTVQGAAVIDSTRANIILVAVGLMVLVGLVCVLMHRFMIRSRHDAADTSMTRPVLAVLLVGAVLILAAASLSMDDADTRNLLIGGVVSLSSAAVAFYFSSTVATEARRDLMAATMGVEQVPDLKGKSLTDAQAIMSGSRLVLAVTNPPAPAGALVTKQDPPAGTSVKGAHSVTVTF